MSATDFTGYAVRRWPVGIWAASDAKVGEVVSRHELAGEAAQAAWALRCIRGAFCFGVIKIVDGQRQLLGSLEHELAARAYIDCDNRRKADLYDARPSGVAA